MLPGSQVFNFSSTLPKARESMEFDYGKNLSQNFELGNGEQC
jgi:hypothetical protein